VNHVCGLAFADTRAFVRKTTPITSIDFCFFMP
jgi:hypothetical protein